jgi:MscS family membrane protein
MQKINIDEFLNLLNSYDPLVIKLVVIIFSVGLIYFIRKVLFDILESLLLKIKTLHDYTKEIVLKIRKPSELATMVINIDLIIFIYNDYNRVDIIREIFSIVYVVLATAIVFLLINAIASVKLDNFKNTDNVKNEVVNITLKIINFVVILIGLLIALHIAGVDLTAILSGLGIGGLAVALAAKDSLANFFGTLSILASNTFSQGDWIEADSKEGVVTEIGLRVTTLRTFDNALIAIPNSILANKDVKNWNRRKLGRRIKMSLGIKYDSKSKDIKNAIVEIREMLRSHPGIATKNTEYNFNSSKRAKLVSKGDAEGVKKTLLVYLDEFSDSSINILIYCFTKSVRWEDWLITKEDVMHKIMEIFEHNNLEFAYPSLSVYHENELDGK